MFNCNRYVFFDNKDVLMVKVDVRGNDLLKNICVNAQIFMEVMFIK